MAIYSGLNHWRAMKELDDEDVCPCGRGMSYAECCKSNGIRWYRDGDALQQQYEAQLPQEGIESFEKYKQKFFTLFGREPVDGDLLLFDVSAHDSEFFRKGITFLRNLGLPKEWIYAYYRTDGLMPTIENEKYLSKMILIYLGTTAASTLI